MSRSGESAFDRVNKLFRPGSVAVVGPSSSAERAGNIILKNLKTFGYPGAVYPVNPSGAQIEGLQSYPTIAACPKSPELAVLAVPYSQVGKVMSDVAAAGTRHAIVVSGGFSDAGAEGKVREKGLLEFCRKNGINLMGPNSIGTFDAVYGFCTAIGKLPAMKASGISMLGQSGMLSTGFPLEEITVRGRGFSKIACMGNKADIDECDLLRYFADDPDTRVIGAYIEGVGDGPRFRRSAEFAARKKPLVILKSGRTELGARAAASHTGALSGADDVYNAIFKQSGAQRVAGFSEFFGILRTFDLCPLPRGNRIGVVSITGMGCVLSADACSDYGMQLAPITEGTREKLRSLAPGWASITNPADIWSTIEQRGPFEAYLKLSEAMISDENVDILLVIAMLLEEGAFDARASFEAVRKAHPDKPILACIFGGRKDLMESFSSGLESIGVPVFYEPGEAIKASSYLYKRRLIQGRNGV